MILPDDDIMHSDNLGRPQRLVVNGLDVTRGFVSLTQLAQLRLRFSRSEHMFKINEKKIEKPLARSSTSALIHS